MINSKLLIFTACLISCTLFLVGCGSDTADPEVENLALASGTIGPQGGDLQSSDFSLTVPADAFSVDAELSLMATETTGFSLEQTTDAFHLVGIPDHWTAPLTLKIRYSGDLSEGNLLVVGFPHEVEETGLQQYRYQYLTATEEEGFLVAELPVFPASPHKNTLDAAVRLFGLTGMRLRQVPDSSDPLFSIHYFTQFDNVMDEIADDFLHAHTFWENFGFTLNHAGQADQNLYPIEVQLRSAESWELEPDTGGTAYIRKSVGVFTPAPGYYFSDGRFELFHHACTPANLPWLREIIGSYYFNFAHYQASPFVDMGNDWLRTAVRAWSEEIFTSTTPHTPAMFLHHQTPLLKGIDQRSDFHDISYGHSFSALIKYLAGRYGPGFLPITYNAIRLQTPGLDALTDALPDEPSVWWPDFTRDFISGELYSVDPDSIINLTDETWVVDEPGNQSLELPLTFPDLSVRILRIYLANESFSPDASIQFQVSSDETDEDNLEVQLYSMQDGEINFLARSTDVTITELNDLQSNGYDLLAVVTCAEMIGGQTGNNTNVQLQVDVFDGSGETPAFNQGRFTMKYHAFFADGTEDQGDMLSQQFAAGSMSGNSFSAVWDTTNTQGVRLSGSFEVNLATDPLRVLNWTYQWHWDFPDSEDYKLYQVIGGELPLDYENGDYKVFRLEEDAVCQSLTNIYFIEVLGGEVQTELENWTCNENSYLNVYLQQQD